MGTLYKVWYKKPRTNEIIEQYFDWYPDARDRLMALMLVGIYATLEVQDNVG